MSSCGTYASYTNYACRCDPCKQAGRDYRANRKKHAVESNFADYVHGNDTYNLGCRCAICVKGAQDTRIIYRLNNPLKFKYLCKKSTITCSGNIFTLTFEEYCSLLETKNCPICNVTLTLGEGEQDPCTLSLDQKKPGQGYTKENVHVICYRCNRIKNDGTAEEHRRIADYMDSLVGSEDGK
jgi:hypothetical protein